MKIRIGIIFTVALVILSCGPRKKEARPAPVTRDFPMAEVPMMITQPDERAQWLCAHFWDRFTAPDSLYFSDSLTVNGVPKEALEQQIGLFATLLQQLPLADGAAAMTAFYKRLEAFQLAHPTGNVFTETVPLVSRYFYDPNSPVRSEDLYLPFVKELAASAIIDPAYKMGYEWDVKMCEMNRTGTPAADFVFIDTAGRRRTLYSVKAARTLLIFGNPDCHACKELLVEMESQAQIAELIGNGSLKVLDIYIDQDIPLWKEKMADYPASWINGYDPSFKIRSDVLYNVRALPSMYLLDADKTVLLKDATTDQILSALL